MNNTEWLCKNQADKIAKRLGLKIPGHTLVDEVPLLLIEKLLDKVEQLENKLSK